MKKFLFGFILFLLLCTTFPVLTQAQLEVEYPDIPDTEQPSDLPSLVIYLYKFLIVFSGIVALGILVWGGIIWMLSGDDPSKVNEAKGRIFSGIAGIVIILSVYLILYAVNPELTIINLREALQPEPIPVAVESGFYICWPPPRVNCPEDDINNLANCLKKELEKGNCEKIGPVYSGNFLKRFFKIYTIPETDENKPNQYLFITGPSRSSDFPRTYEYCAAITNKPEHFSTINNEGLVGGDPSFLDRGNNTFPGAYIITSGNYYNHESQAIKHLENDDYLPGLKLCEFLNCPEKHKTCEKELAIIKDIGITKTSMAKSFNGIIYPIREMRFQEMTGMNIDYAVMLWKDQDFKGPCYFSFSGEKILLNNFYIDNQVDQNQYLECKDEDGNIIKDNQGNKKKFINQSYNAPFAQIGSAVILPL